jgi:hypothetical protein
VRTVKSCGPDASTPASSWRKKLSADDGDKQARSPGRARRKPLKPLRAGMPGESGCNRGDYARMLIFILHARLRVRLAPGIPHALCLRGEGFTHSSGALRRGNAEVCLMNANAPHFQSSSPAKAGDPVFRDVGDGIERLRRTGYPACAGYDVVCGTGCTGERTTMRRPGERRDPYAAAYR